MSHNRTMQNSRCNPTHLGFPHSPFKAQFFQCAPQLAFKGKFVNPLRNAALVVQYFKTTPSTKGLAALHYTSIRVNRLASLNDLRSFTFHSVCSPFEPSLRVGKAVQIQEPRSSALVPDSISSSSYQHQAQKPSFHSFHSNTLRPSRSSTDCATFRSIHSRCL